MPAKLKGDGPLEHRFKALHPIEVITLTSKVEENKCLSGPLSRYTNNASLLTANQKLSFFPCAFYEVVSLLSLSVRWIIGWLTLRIVAHCVCIISHLPFCLSGQREIKLFQEKWKTVYWFFLFCSSYFWICIAYTIFLSPTLNTCSQMIKDEKAQCSLTRLWATASNERKRGAVQFIIYHYREYTLPPSLSHSRIYFLSPVSFSHSNKRWANYYFLYKWRWRVSIKDLHITMTLIAAV